MAIPCEVKSSEEGRLIVFPGVFDPLVEAIGDIEFSESVFFDCDFHGFEAHCVKHIGSLFEDLNLIVGEFEESRFIPIEIAIDSVVGKTDSFDRLSPIWAQSLSDAFHKIVRIIERRD